MLATNPCVFFVSQREPTPTVLQLESLGSGRNLVHNWFTTGLRPHVTPGCPPAAHCGSAVFRFMVQVPAFEQPEPLNCRIPARILTLGTGLSIVWEFGQRKP